VSSSDLGFFGAVAGAFFVALAFEADPKIGGALLVLIVLGMLGTAQRAGLLKGTS
jgi:hypothetical protein